jgi:hypothetical protein
MQLPDTKLLLIAGVLVILVFIWWMSPKSKSKESFQNIDDEDDDSGAMVFPPGQCEKLQGLRVSVQGEINKAKISGNVGGRKAYESALKALENTMSLSNCDMNSGPMTQEEAVVASLGNEGQGQEELTA